MQKVAELTEMLFVVLTHMDHVLDRDTCGRHLANTTEQFVLPSL